MRTTMSKTFTGSDVNDIYYRAISTIVERGIKTESRNGTVYRQPGTLISHYHNPQNRMLFAPGRDANPFFHIFESLWMLAGRNDVAFPAHYVPHMKTFSDDGLTFNGAYGYRWRHAFGMDQIELIVKELHRNPQSRRVYLQMWDARLDLQYGMDGGKDACCNLGAKFEIDDDGRLNMWVNCRSNDMILGGYGANVVHFSFLQEYIVDRLRALGSSIEMGFYEQISMNAHVYEKLYPPKLWEGVQKDIAAWEHEERVDAVVDAYWVSADYLHPSKEGLPYLMTISPILFEGSLSDNPKFKAESVAITASAKFDEEVRLITDLSLDKGLQLESPYLKYIVLPMMTAYEFYKAGALQEAFDKIHNMRLKIQELFKLQDHIRFDVEYACSKWLERRLEAKKLKEA